MQQDQDRFDPASSAQAQALRVLLGPGDAQAGDASSFIFDGRAYRGSFSRTSDGQIVNLVPLEAYLYSVVPREMPRSWPAAALQAQAIVARTYVLQRSSPLREYDLVPSEADQVYTGIDAEHPETSAAVDATRGGVLRFANGFAQALYSSCCGGHTESNADAWGGRPLPYLSGVRCTYCSPSPYYTWSKSIPSDELQSALGAQLDNAGDVQSIDLDSPDPSGRARSWRFNGPSGSVDIDAKNVRRALGSRTLPSLLVRKVTVDGQGGQAAAAFIIEGGGLGHGVGLCQWGARGMAAQGSPVRGILAYYYPGTTIAGD